MTKNWQAAAVLAIALAMAGCRSGTPDRDNPSTERTTDQSGQKQGSGEFRARAFLVEGTDTVVLEALGQ